MSRRSYLLSCCLLLVVGLSVGESNAKAPLKARERSRECPDPVVCLCHVPPGNPSNAHTICVGAPAVEAHLAHGDRLGACSAQCGGPEGIPCEEGQFCKRPDGACAPEAEGMCMGIPINCPTDFAPVCGCDGETYPNACYADAAGVPVAFPGECEPAQACGGSAGDTCDTGQFCRREPGECAEDAEGVCADIPLNCPAIYAPVCGCDGMTYDNACNAAYAGVTILTMGECHEGEGQACGGSEGQMCAEGLYCRTSEGECAEDAEGICVPIPQACPASFAPVCGCDGVTYVNACLAAASGVNVSSLGECEQGGGQACGGTAGDTCDAGQYCQTGEGECAEDAEGVCATIPLECPLTLDPVCGCDGVTYDNACNAAGNGVNVAYAGECDQGGGQACGGTAGDTCDAGQYCQTSEGECAEDAEGVCATIPLECPLTLDPVCGCDGVTYDNACNAAGNGVNVAQAGECGG